MQTKVKKSLNQINLLSQNEQIHPTSCGQSFIRLEDLFYCFQYISNKKAEEEGGEFRKLEERADRGN